MTTVFFYKPFENVQARPSNSSYGRWVVKTDEVTFRFFWYKADADRFALEHNKRTKESNRQCLTHTASMS